MNLKQMFSKLTLRKWLIVVSVILFAVIMGIFAYLIFASKHKVTDTETEETQQTDDGEADDKNGDGENGERDDENGNEGETLGDAIRVRYFDSMQEVEMQDFFSVVYYDLFKFENFTFYKVGEVVEGMTSEGVDLEGYDCIIGTHKTEPKFYVEVLALDGRESMYVSGFRMGYDMAQVDFKSFVKIIDTSPWGISYFNQIEPYVEGDFRSANAYKSKNGHLYHYISFYAKPFDQMGLSNVVDEIDGYDIYLSAEGKQYTRSVEGFTYRLVYFPAIINQADVLDYSLIPEITWKDGTVNKYEYDYISIGDCSAEFDLELSDLSMGELALAGTAKNGDKVYVPIDANHAFQKKLYEEDYITGIYEFNSIEEDDDMPFDYETYLSYYPVFYYQDAFGRMITFASREFVFTGGCAKPAIYLYPENPSILNVKVIANGVLRFTAPLHGESGWTVIANSAGQILNLADMRKYDYLWWDSVARDLNVPERGFVVSRVELDKFIHDKLSDFGLNENELKDFKDYWLEKMCAEGSDYYFVTFLFNGEVDQIASLEFSKDPDSVIRVFMLWRSADKEERTGIAPLEIPVMQRVGFTVVEWGGAQL